MWIAVAKQRLLSDLFLFYSLLWLRYKKKISSGYCKGPLDLFCYIINCGYIRFTNERAFLHEKNTTFYLFNQLEDQE